MDIPLTSQGLDTLEGAWCKALQGTRFFWVEFLVLEAAGERATDGDLVVSAFARDPRSGK